MNSVSPPGRRSTTTQEARHATRHLSGRNADRLRFYQDTSTEILIGGSMSIVSVAFLVWFGTVLRERLTAGEGSLGSGAPLVAFAGTVLAAAAGLGAETINMAGAAAAEDGQLSAASARIYFDVSYALGGPAAGAAFALVAIPTALVALRADPFSQHPRPGWR